MISAGGIPIRRTDQAWQRVPGNGLGGAYRVAKPIRVADKISVQSNKTTLIFEPAMMLDMLRNAVLPAANRAFGPRFSSYGGAISFLKQCGYSSLRSLPISLLKAFTPRMLKILRLRYPAFKKKFDRYYGFFTGRHAKSVRNSAQAKMMYGTIFRQTQVAGATGAKCPSGSAPSSTPPATPPATPVIRPTAGPADKQMALQSTLVAAVRKVYGASKSELYAVTILRTQKWSTLKQLGVVSHIQTALTELGYRRAANNSYLAQRLVQKTLRNWRKSSGTVQPPPSQIAPTRRPAPRPAKPVPAATNPRPNSANKQLALHNALIAAVRKVYGASKSESYAVTILRIQKWSTLKELGVVSHIQAGFRSLGYMRAGGNSHLAQRLVKKTLRNWKKSS